MSDDAATGSDLVSEVSSGGTARMDVPTSQQLIREMTTLTSALFSLLQPDRAPAPEPTTAQIAPSMPAAPAPAIGSAVPLPQLPSLSIPVPSVPVASIPVPTVPMVATEAPEVPHPAATAPSASIPVPSLPVPDLPSSEAEPEPADEEDQPAPNSQQSMALMNEIAFLDD